MCTIFTRYIPWRAQSYPLGWAQTWRRFQALHQGTAEQRPSGCQHCEKKGGNHKILHIKKCQLYVSLHGRHNYYYENLMFHTTKLLSSPEIFSHGVFSIGVVETHSDLSTAVQTKGLGLTRHLTLARHGEWHSTNKFLGYLNDPKIGRETGGVREAGREREGERERERERERDASEL